MGIEKPSWESLNKVCMYVCNCLWLVYIQIHWFRYLWSCTGIQRSKFRIFRVVHQETENALNKLPRMSRVRHNAKSIENRYNSKSIENRYNSFKILTKLFETFNCPLHERPRHFEKVKQLINILFCGYRRRLEITWVSGPPRVWARLEIADPLNVPKPILARGTGCPSE
jgi:hypothetical protein